MERTDIENMRQIPIADFLARLGHEPVRRSGNELWYRAPYRSERTPSFRVNVAKQLWYDFGLGKGRRHLHACRGVYPKRGFHGAGEIHSGNRPYAACRSRKPLYLPEPSEPAFEGVEAVPLLRSPLTEYLKERGIPYAVASRHCCRLNYGVRGKRYFAVGFPNVSGGYETRSRRFKGCVPPKDVSLIKAEDTAADVCSVFEGFMDFLSAATLGLATSDSLVLNSVANVGKAVKHLDGYGRIDCYLDRDEAGRRAMGALRTRYGGKVTDRSGIYQGCKDLNEYLQQVSRKQQKNNNLKIKE